MRQERREELREVQGLTAYHPEVEEVRTYLNSQHPHLFNECVERNYEAAWLKALQKEDPAVSKAARLNLRCIKAQPQPVYFPSPEGNTVRLFTAQSMATLPRDVRKELTSGWPEVDVRCSQLAICAALWNAESINGFLRSGDSFWDHLLQSIGVPQSDWAIAKEALKPSVYAVCYGMERHRIPGTTALRLKKVGLDTHYAARFVNHRLIQALLVAREEAWRVIEQECGATTCYGKECPVTPVRQPRQIMAEVAQALEMKMILPAFKLAQQTQDFTIVLFQHDGFSVHFMRRADMWQERIAQAIQEEIHQQGIQTGLEWQMEEAEVGRS
jgi:hypothetical protein